MGILKKPATWVAEKIADVLLGGDVLAPEREGTQIDWQVMEIEKPRKSLTAGIPRIQLELAIGAANRRLEEKMDAEGCRALIKRAPEIETGEMMAVKLGESCSLTIEGRDGKLLWLELVGSGTMNDFFWDEILGRASEVGRPDEIEKRPHSGEGGL
ncbi:MAG TPA: hypothetical protein DDW68_14460 [Verrucomicrobiales bacterium]|nr:hypothetical protein [Verrucomicrobiales bacterium]HBE98366.1 hypothetical protein [Verrucomicrobiales bacterium]